MNSLAKFLLSVIAILASAQQDFPDTGFAVLGIGGTGASDRAGVEVVVLRSGGPAERSGIQVGDIVVAMGGLPVISYEELMDLVSRRAPGDSVSIEIEREGKRVALRLALLDARKVCNEGNGWACSVLALRYDDGDVFEEDQHKASLFFERGCEHGYIPACGLLANKYKYGEGVSKDLVRAAELFRRTCVAEYAYACLYLGEAYELGEGVEKNLALALEFYERSCDLGEAYACFTLGNLYQDGRGVAKDWEIAAKFHRKACDGGWDLGCEEWRYVSRRSPSEVREPKTFPLATPELNASLVKAVEEGKIVDVRRFLEEGADPNSRGDFGSMRDVRLMKIAIFKEQPEIVRMLIEAGVDIEGKDPNNVATPLTAAIGQGHMETVGVLLELGAKVRNGDLGTAAGYGTPEMMRRLMQEGITVDDLYLSYTPAIKHAAEMKRFENVDFLLEHGGDIDALDANDKHTALTYAVDKRDLEVAEFLLSRGADVDKANGEGMTALVYAAGKGDIYLLRLLLAHGANADTMTDVGFTGLLMAVLNRQKESVRVLLAHGANVDKAAANGTTPLMFAAALNEYEIAKLIVEKGADVNVVAKSGDLAGHSALSIAREAGHTEFAALLRAAGAREP